MSELVAPATGREVDELRAGLRREIARTLSRRVDIVSLDLQRSEYASSHPLDELHVGLDDGVELHLILKDLSPGSLLHVARRARPEFLTDPRREIEVYRRFLAGSPVAPLFWGAVRHPAVGRYWLFLEKLDGTELSQVGEHSIWIAAARRLALMHSRFARASVGRSRVPVRYTDRFYREWPRRARAMLARTDRLSLVAARLVERLEAGYAGVIGALQRLPMTLIHGDLYPSNVLVANGTTAPDVRFVDWELAAVAPGLVDLAALTSGDWSDDERLAMACAYREELTDPSRPPLDRFLVSLDLCRLHLAVQWLGWANEWSPPLAHQHDWLREALRLTERVGL